MKLILTHIINSFSNLFCPLVDTCISLTKLDYFVFLYFDVPPNIRFDLASLLPCMHVLHVMWIKEFAYFFWYFVQTRHFYRSYLNFPIFQRHADEQRLYIVFIMHVAAICFFQSSSLPSFSLVVCGYWHTVDSMFIQYIFTLFLLFSIASFSALRSFPITYQQKKIKLFINSLTLLNFHFIFAPSFLGTIHIHCTVTFYRIEQRRQ